MTQWNAEINHFNGRYWSQSRFIIVDSSVPSGAASVAIRKYRKRYIKPKKRVEAYRLVLTRIPNHREDEKGGNND